ncbi:Queuine tRNA-ribosyltransferase [Dirofilaria immitis]
MKNLWSLFGQASYALYMRAIALCLLFNLLYFNKLFSTLFSIIGLSYFHIDSDIWNIYSPINGMSRAEEKALERFEYASIFHEYRLRQL